MNDEELIERYIEHDVRMPSPDRARLKESGVSIWALVSYLHYAAGGDGARVAVDYDVPRDAVAAAVAYYRRHTAAIDARIAVNTSPIDDMAQAA